MWEIRLVPLDGAAPSMHGYFELRPSDLAGTDVLVLDVRSLDEVRGVSIACCQQLDPDSELTHLRAVLPSTFPVVFVCDYGPESKDACKRLHAMGHAEVYHLVGGMRRWLAEGHPVVRDAKCERFADSNEART